MDPNINIIPTNHVEQLNKLGNDILGRHKGEVQDAKWGFVPKEVQDIDGNIYEVLTPFMIVEFK